MPANSPLRTERLQNDSARLGVGGGIVVARQGGRVRRRGGDIARAVAEGQRLRSGRSGLITIDKALGQVLEVQL